MLTKQQLNIMSVFKENIFNQLTFKQIKNKSKQKSNNVVQIAIKEFQKLNIIESKKIADITIHQLNLDNSLTMAFLNLINEEEVIKNKIIPKNTIDKIIKKVFSHTNSFTLLVFGSYAKNKTRSKSDLDIAIIVDSEQTKKEIIPLLETEKRRETIPIDYHIFTQKEFQEMLKENEPNLGKEIYNNNIICRGYINYIEIIKGLKNEFNNRIIFTKS